MTHVIETRTLNRTPIHLRTSRPTSPRTSRPTAFKRIGAKAMAAVLAVGLLGGCVTDDVGTKQLLGSAVGAGLGGFGASKIGKGKGQLAAIAGGTILGALIGGGIGSSLDKADRMHAKRAQDQALSAPVGRTIAWSNPHSGNRGTVTATREGRDTRSGAYCREYYTDIQVGGDTQTAYGTACQMPDGSWQIAETH